MLVMSILSNVACTSANPACAHELLGMWLSRRSRSVSEAMTSRARGPAIFIPARPEVTSVMYRHGSPLGEIPAFVLQPLEHLCSKFAQTAFEGLDGVLQGFGGTQTVWLGAGGLVAFELALGILHFALLAFALAQ